MNPKLKVWLPLLLSGTMVIGMVIGYRIHERMPGKPFFALDKSHPMQELMDVIQSKYVDEVNLRDLSDTAIQALLTRLDPHSVFIPAEELQQVNEEMAGQFFGIGIEFDIINDTLNVLTVLPDGPAAKAGLLAGDHLIKVNDSLVAGIQIKSDRIRQLLRGAFNSPVFLEIDRQGKRLKQEVKRGLIPIVSVDAAYMLNDTTAFIRLNRFTQNTYKEFMVALEKLVKNHPKALILDLRGNGGGILDEATAIADEFLDGDKLVTYTEGKHAPRKEYRCKKPGLFETGKLMILADEGSASASEILMGALQEWDRATIIGRRSFGKGLVQEQFELSDGSALRLTVARYYTPLGRSIQRPYAPGDKSAYYAEVYHRDSASQGIADSANQKIYRTRGGKQLRGGGGIAPDIFVAADSQGISTPVARFITHGKMTELAYHYYLNHKAELDKFKTASELAQGITVTEQTWKEWQPVFREDSLDIQMLSIADRQFIEKRFRPALARQIWRNTGFVQAANLDDPFIKAALNNK